MFINVARPTDPFHPLQNPPPHRRSMGPGATRCLTYSRGCRLTCSRRRSSPQPSRLVSTSSLHVVLPRSCIRIISSRTDNTIKLRPLGSDHARFKFAKDAIEVRKKAGISRGTGAEETVVLAFGGGNGTAGASAVHVTRKLRKKPLWKINA